MFGFGAAGAFGFGLDLTGAGSNGADGTSFLHDINKTADNNIANFITDCFLAKLGSSNPISLQQSLWIL